MMKTASVSLTNSIRRRSINAYSKTPTPSFLPSKATNPTPTTPQVPDELSNVRDILLGSVVISAMGVVGVTYEMFDNEI